MGIEHRQPTPKAAAEKSVTSLPLHPQDKPITIVHLRHGPFDGENLAMVDWAIRRQIEASNITDPEKKVIAMLESSGGSKEDAVALRINTGERAMLPSEGLSEIFIEKAFPDGVPDAFDRERVPEVLPSIVGPYRATLYTKLDNIATDHPGKLEVTTEFWDPETTETISRPIVDASYHFLESTIGQQPEAVDTEKFRYAASAIADVSSLRDYENAATIMDLVDEEHVYGVVHPEGPLHRSGDILREEGYNVVEMVEEQYSLLPNTLLMRNMMADPSLEVTDEMIRESVQATNDVLGITSKDTPEVIEAKKQIHIRRG